MTNKEMVIQHNDLISGRHNWSTNEIKIVLKSITEITEDDLLVKFSRTEILSLISDKDLNSRELKNTAKKLGSKIFEIKEENNKDWSILPWFAKIEYKQGIFSIEYNYHMKPFLLNLKKNFTKFNIQNILAMKSNYSMRIYQLLKQYQRIGSRNFKIEELRDILKVPTSYNINNFREVVILKAQQEMEEYSDLTFDFEEIKTGRKITDIKFNIKRKENNKHIQIEDKEENPWYFYKYYGRSVFSNDITYENIIEIKEGEKYLTIIFEDNDSIKVKDEDALIKILID